MANPPPVVSHAEALRAAIKEMRAWTTLGEQERLAGPPYIGASCDLILQWAIAIEAALAIPSPATSVAPIPLNAQQEHAVKEWAADDRLWTTQDTVEFNLRTFARVILAAIPSPDLRAPDREALREIAEGRTEAHGLSPQEYAKRYLAIDEERRETP